MFFPVHYEVHFRPKKWTREANILSNWDIFLRFRTQKERKIA